MDFCVHIEEEGFYDEEIHLMGGKIFYIPPKTKDFKGFRNGLKKLIKREKYEYVLRITANAFGFLDLGLAKKAGVQVYLHQQPRRTRHLERHHRRQLSVLFSLP